MSQVFTMSWDSAMWQLEIELKINKVSISIAAETGEVWYTQRVPERCWQLSVFPSLARERTAL